MTVESLNIGDRIEVTTERLAYGGDAVAHHHGLTIFIPLAAPGERLRVRIIERKKSYARAVIEAITKFSPARRAPLCDYFGDCGGCQLQHLIYTAQLEAKAGFIRDALWRIGRLAWPGEIPVRHAAETGYRARAQIKLNSDASPTGEAVLIGFNRTSSNAVCDVVHCPVLVPELDSALAHLRELASKREGGLQPDILRLPELDMAAGDTDIAFAPTISGLPSGTITRTVKDLIYRFTPLTFFQGNALLLETLIDEVLSDYAGRLAIDLYAGVGLFTLQLARRFKRVVGVESNRQAVQYARQNITANPLKNIALRHARVEQWLSEYMIEQARASAPVDLLLLDPPRAGAAEAMAGIIALQPARIVYVSCDPATMARDLRRLSDGGYRLDRVTGVDLFPQTYHIETVAHLQRE